MTVTQSTKVSAEMTMTLLTLETLQGTKSVKNLMGKQREREEEDLSEEGDEALEESHVEKAASSAPAT